MPNDPISTITVNNKTYDIKAVQYSDVIQSKRGIFTSSTDAAINSANAVALITGSPTGEHLEFDGNEILAKNGNTSGSLYLNGGGAVSISGELSIGGKVISKDTTGKNTFWAAPSDKNGRPEMRKITVDDLPNGISLSKTKDILSLAQGGTGKNNNTTISPNTVFIGPASGTTAGKASFRKIAENDLPSISTSKITGLGTELHAERSTAKPCATGQWSVLTNKTLSAGTWIVVGTINWQTNGSGLRGAVITAVSDESKISANPSSSSSATRCGAASGQSTLINTVRIMILSNSTTVYLHGWQSSGAALNCNNAYLAAIKIK